MRVIRGLLGLGLVVLVLGCGRQGAEAVPVKADPVTEATAPSGPPEPPAVQGVDLSKYQGEVDFEKLARARITYVFLKATQGVDYQDPLFGENLKRARAAGLTVGAYHYYMTNDEPEDQAANFIAHAPLLPGDLPPVVDIESMHQQSLPHLPKRLRTFLEKLHAHYGVRPILYTGRKFANAYLTDFGDHPLWLAEYEVPEPTLPQGWGDWVFWQWSQSGTLDGVQGTVDLDRHNGDEASFKRLVIP